MTGTDPFLSAPDAAGAHLLIGAGGGKLARQFIQQRFCAAACGACAHCLKLAHGTHPDVRWLRAEGKHLRIDQIRALQKDALYPPLEAPLKVFVLEEADRLSREAANSLLKILESPPSFVVFLLLTQRLGELLPTVVSRCRIVRRDGGAPAGEEERLCWGNGVWLDLFPLGEATAAPLGAGVEDAAALCAQLDGEDLATMHAATEALYRAATAWPVAERLRAAGLLAKLPRPKLEYALNGLATLCHRHGGQGIWVRPAVDQLNRSCGALRRNANAQLLVESCLLRLGGPLSGRPGGAPQ